MESSPGPQEQTPADERPHKKARLTSVPAPVRFSIPSPASTTNSLVQASTGRETPRHATPSNYRHPFIQNAPKGKAKDSQTSTQGSAPGPSKLAMIAALGSKPARHVDDRGGTAGAEKGGKDASGSSKHDHLISECAWRD